MGKTIVNLKGQRYGMLTVLEMQGSKNGHATWRCKCDCGNEKVIIGNSLRTGRTRSCGCLAVAVAKAYPHRNERIETLKKAHTQHGMTGSKLHYIWGTMKQRCLNPNNAQYKNYGGRGITVCEEWLNSFEAFRDWAMSNGYEEGLTIDRIDVNGNYCPENCRWATQTEQSRNTRRSIKITLCGETHTLKEWAAIKNISYTTLVAKYHSGHDVTAILRNKEE